MKYKEKLNEIIKRKYITKENASDITGVSANYLSIIVSKKGRGLKKINTLVRLMKKLGLTEEERQEIIKEYIKEAQ